MLLETLTNTLTVLKELLSASHDAGVFLRSESLGSEVVNTVRKALLDQAGVKLKS